MGNQPYKSQGTLHSEQIPPPRPVKPLHLQASVLPSLPTNPNDPRAFILPSDDNYLQFNSDVSNESLPLESGVYEYVDVSDIQSTSMSLKDLTDEYGNQFPLRFRVSESLYGICEDGSLMEGQLLNVMFEKRTKVVKIQANTGAKYSVPINTSLQFGILYNPYNKLESAKKGYIFSKVSDLIAASSLPRAVTVTKPFQYKSSNSTWEIMEGQILILHGTTEDSKLKCSPLKMQVTLLLDESIEGCFSTSSRFLKLYMHDVIEHFKLPVCVTLENSNVQKIHLPLHATVDTYTIVEQDVERSVVVNSKFGKDYELIEILLNVPIEAQLVKASDHQLHVLRQETEHIFKTFHPSKLSKVIVDTNSSTNYIQTMLFKVVPNDDSWMNGVELFPPQPPSIAIFTNVQDDDDEYIDMSVSPNSPLSDSHYEIPIVPGLQYSKSFTMPSTPHFISQTASLQPVACSTLHTGHKPKVALSHESSNKSSQNSSYLDPVPYMVVKPDSGGKLTHEAPYQYVKFSNNQKNEVEVLKQKVSVLESANSQLTSRLKQMQIEGEYNYVA